MVLADLARSFSRRLTMNDRPQLATFRPLAETAIFNIAKR